MDFQPQVNEELLDQAIALHGLSLVSILHQVQDHYGYLPEVVLRALCRKSGIPLTEIYGVATFYSYFSLKPRGRHQITVCSGTSCHVRGSGRVIKEVCNLLQIQIGQVTPDGEFSIETVNCLGCCAFAPVMVVNGQYHVHLSPAKAREIIISIREDAARESDLQTQEAEQEREAVPLQKDVSLR